MAITLRSILTPDSPLPTLRGAGCCDLGSVAGCGARTAATSAEVYLARKVGPPLAQAVPIVRVRASSPVSSPNELIANELACSDLERRQGYACTATGRRHVKTTKHERSGRHAGVPGRRPYHPQ